MELTQLHYFRTLARFCHMTRAAQDLLITQPALSAQIAKLEHELGSPLFFRQGRGMALTPAGRVFLEHVERVFQEVESGRQAIAALEGLQRGSITIGGGATATTYLLPPIVGAFRQKHPQIHFYIREANSRSVLDAVQAGQLDLGVVTLPVPTDKMRVIPWIDDEFVLIVPPGHRLAGKGILRVKELAGEPFVMFEAGSAVRQMIDQALAGVAIQVVMELRSIESIKQMVLAGIGCAMVSRLALRTIDVTSGGLPPPAVCKDGKLSRQLAILHRLDRPLSPAAGEFLEFLLRRMVPPAAVQP